MVTMTAAHPHPPAPRSIRRRFGWVDPRLVVGLVLVAASIAGVAFLVHSVDQRVLVYTAARTLSPGDALTADMLSTEPMRLGEGFEHYFAATDALPEGAQVTRVIAAGELVPRSALGSAAAEQVSSVVIPVAGALPRAVDAGAQVEVWAAEQLEHLSFAPPRVVTSATVAAVTRPSAVALGSGITVELRVPRESVAHVLESVANKDAISLIPRGDAPVSLEQATQSEQATRPEQAAQLEQAAP